MRFCAMSIVLFVPIPTADFSFSSLFSCWITACLLFFLSICLCLFLRKHLTDTKYAPPRNRHTQTHTQMNIYHNEYYTYCN